jgi:hypothetical protein
MYRLIINYDDDALTIMNNVNATLKEYGVELKLLRTIKLTNRHIRMVAVECFMI